MAGRFSLKVARESWPIAGSFTISRGAKTAAETVVATITCESERGQVSGSGECVPYARYGESVEGVLETIESVRDQIEAFDTPDTEQLQDCLPSGAARNALDCALWDLRAQLEGRPVWQLAGLSPPMPVTTAYTISLGTPEAMAEATRKASGRPLLKLKLGGDGDVERVRAVRGAAPEARLIVDANEAWTADMIERFTPEMAALGVELIEQPLPAGDDAILKNVARSVPLCADESAHDRRGLEDLAERYDVMNVKLDKTGGLTEAIATVHAARGLGLKIFVGCMVATSLAMAPALMLATDADYVDLDGPLLLAKDREPGLVFEGARIAPPPAGLWGIPG